MKKILALALVLCMVLSLVPAVSAAETGMTQAEAEAAVATLNANSDFYYELVENYADSDIEHRSEVRWWMAEGGHTDETLLEEVQAMYDAGFRGVELCQLNVGKMDAGVYGYGSEQWNHDFHLVMNKALDLGMTVGITSGTNWNTANVPGLDPDSQGANQCVFMTTENVAAGATRTGAIVTSKVTTSVGWNGQVSTKEVKVRDVHTFIGAYAFKVVDGTSDPIQLDSTAMVDLSDQIVTTEDGTRTLEWTAPEDGNYTIFYYFQQGTAQKSDPSTIPSYCINYLDTAGMDAWSEYFAANVLNDPELNAKIKAGDVQMFMDSLEYNHGDGITLWAQNLAETFLEKKGYDIRPYVLLTAGQPTLYTLEPAPTEYGTYNLVDENLAQRIRNDLFEVQTEMYMYNFMQPLNEWLDQYGISLRAQISYGKYLEIYEPSLVVDYPEAENLNQRNQVDLYRLWSGAAKLQNKTLSAETSALVGMAYSYTFQKNLEEAYSLYAAGFNRINWHIWSSQWAPDTVWANNGQKFPGFVNLNGFNCFGLREIAYNSYWELNQHMGRVQELLREGVSRTDIGIPYTKYGQATVVFTEPEYDMWMQRHDYMLLPTMELQENGYTYDYFSPEFFEADEVYYNEETGTLELAGYKALLLWQEWLELDGAKYILDIAKKGMKIVIIDGAAVQTPYNEGKDEELAAVMAELKALDNVAVVPTADDVMEALQGMDVVPYAAYESQQILTQVREDEDGNRFLYVFNYCNEELHDETCTSHGTHASEDIVMEGTFVPYFIDSWTGEVTQVANYRWEDGNTVIHVELDFDEIALFAFEAVDAEPEHIVASDLEGTVTAEGIVLRATESGTYTTELSHGRTVKTTVEVPAAFDITGWNIDVLSYSEGEVIYRQDTYTDSKGNTTREQNIDTKKEWIKGVKVDKLTTWENIPEIGQNISGIGYYTATFNWDGKADGAYLDFGNIHQCMTVTINGTLLPSVDIFNPVMDISAYLVEGENTVEMEYRSTWTNRLLADGIIKVTHEYEGSFRKLWGGFDVNWRSYGPEQAVVIPYMEETVEVLENNTVTLNVVGAADATVEEAELAYDITVEGAEALATATLTIAVDGAAAEFVPGEGWTALAETNEDGVIEIVLINNAGVNGTAVLGTVVAQNPGVVGTVTVEVTEAVLSAYVGDGETFVNAIIGEAAVTAVDYSIYDVNEDGTVNQLDITRAQRLYGQKTAEKADVDKDGEVTITDLVLILNNYSK